MLRVLRNDENDVVCTGAKVIEYRYDSWGKLKSTGTLATSTDDSGQGWWIVAGAAIGFLVGGAAKIVSNVVSGKTWYDGALGAAVGGAVYGGVFAATGNVVAAGFAGAATESVFNQVSSYVHGLAQANGNKTTKKVTKTNFVNSIKTAVVETVVNGTVSVVTGKIAGKIVPTNNGWFKPQKFVSSFAGKYAIKSELQSLTQGGMLSVIDMFKQACHNWFKQGQQPTVTFFPDTQIRAVG